eukprot:356376-Chlamydomonas_euryale.AAC.7
MQQQTRRSAIGACAGTPHMLSCPCSVPVCLIYHFARVAKSSTRGNFHQHVGVARRRSAPAGLAAAAMHA